MLRLLLPVLIPSWRFFDTVGLAPCIEFTPLAHEHGSPTQWRTFRAKPARRSWHETLLHLVWDPRGNETLYLLGCAERLLESGASSAEREIRDAVAAEIVALDPSTRWARFRVRLEGHEADPAAPIEFESSSFPVGAA